VHIEHRVPTSPRVESGGVGVAIGDDHEQKDTQHKEEVANRGLVDHPDPATKHKVGENRCKASAMA
jgi:hypothetical protein